MNDYGHEYADNRLKVLEKKIKKEYSKAAAEAYRKALVYLNGFETRDKILLEKVKSGQMPVDMYYKWRQNEIAMGRHWEEITKQLVTDYVNAGKVSQDMIMEHSLDVFAVNFNFGTFEAEKASLFDTSFTLYDKETVRRLLEDDPTLLPEPKLSNGKAIRWNRKQIQSVATQSILQGDSIPTIAERLATTVGNDNMHSAIRNARTMTTSAENGGRVESYKRAERLGIHMKKEWLATEDKRTRDSHREINGEQVGVNEEFSNGLEYPGDASGEPSEVWNCRCTLVGALESIDYDVDLPENPDFKNMNFKEWQNGKRNY